MDDALAHGSTKNFRLFFSRVLILVVMDDALAHDETF